MIDLEEVLSVFRSSQKPGELFRPALVDVVASGLPQPLNREAGPQPILQANSHLKVEPLTGIPHDQVVVAVDSTVFVLGEVTDGVVCALRAAVVRHEPAHRPEIQRYGPYLAMVVNQTKDAMYKRLQRAVYGHSFGKSPALLEVVNRLRSMLEQRIQLSLAQTLEESMLMLDGSLVSGYVGSPARFTDALLERSRSRGVDVVAIAKQTTLALLQGRRSILSVLDDHEEASFAEVKSHIVGNRSPYRGNIYVCRFISHGETFRTDVRASNDGTALRRVAGLAGDFGYPEELRLSHVYSVFDAPEVLELQAAAISLSGLEMRDNLRKRLFGPWG